MNNVNRRTVTTIIFVLLSSLLIQSFPLSQKSFAANDVVEPDGDGATGSWNSTGGNYYTELDDGFTQPDTPTTSDYVYADAASGGNLFQRMETIGGEIYLITRVRVRIYHNDGSNGRVNVELFDDDESTSLASEITIGRNNSTDGWDTANFNGLELFPSQLDSLSVRLRPSLHNGGNPSNDVTVYAMYADITYDLTPRFRQQAFRFYANDDSTDVGSPLADQDANTVLTSAGQDFRVRILLDVLRADISLDREDFKLQYVGPGTGSCASPSGGTPSSWTDVTGSTLIAYNNNATPTDEDALTANANDPTFGGDTVYNQSYQEANNLSNSVNAIVQNDSALWDFSLTDNSAPVSTSYCLRLVEPDGTEIFSYNQYPYVTTSGGTLSVDIVDSDGIPVASPSRNLTNTSFSFDCDTTTGQIGVGQQRVRVDNGTGNHEWTLTIAATGGATDTWDDGGSNEYDFNDPGGSPSGCGDGGDSDSVAGQLSFILGSVNITPEGGCSSTGLSAGSDVGFEEGTTDSVTLMVASSSADAGCYWDFRNMDVSQRIPPEQTESSYSINMTVTVTAI